MAIDNTGKPARGLPYILRNPLEETPPSDNTGIVPTPAVDFFPSDMDEKIAVTFNMSFNEFTTFASAIDIGRDIGWSNSNDVYRVWVKSIIGIGGETVTCEDIADCIETNEITQDAIANAINSNTTLQDTIINQTGGLGDVNRIVADKTKFADRNPPQSLQTDVKTLENCDLNTLWGGLRYGLVERADDDVRSVLESLAAITSIPDRLIEFIEIIPVVGDLAQATLDLATEAIPTLLAFFDSYSSLDHMDEYACGLFSIVCEECRYPTFQEIWDYNKSFGIETMPEMASAVFQAVVDALVGSSESASQIAYFTLMNFRLATLLLQATFNGKTGTSAVIQDATLGEDFGNDNWLALCETCNASYQLWTWDFVTQGQGEFYADTLPTVSKPVFQAGMGWRAVNFSSGRRLDVALTFDPAWQVRAVAFNITGTTSAQQWVRRPNWGSSTGSSTSASGTSGGGYSRCFSGYVSLTGNNEIVFFSQGAADAVIYLQRVAILFNTGYGKGGITTTDIDPCT
jgi:hypothetical protein